jgi:branched-chain amino acid transport system ATP-binding protein
MPPTSGSIAFAGRTVAGEPPEALCRAGIGRTFQIPRPFHGLTALENVSIGALSHAGSIGAARAKAMELLERFGFAAMADYHPDQLTLPDRKLLELMRALATQPRLLLLDEVMAGLRPAECQRIEAVLRALNDQGLTIVLVEHNMRVVMNLARQVIVLNQGEKVMQGTPEEVSRDARVIEFYLGKRKVVA